MLLSFVRRRCRRARTGVTVLVGLAGCLAVGIIGWSAWSRRPAPLPQLSESRPRPFTEGVLNPSSIGGLLGEPIGTLGAAPGHGEGPLRSVAVSGDGQLLATGGYDGMIRVWDATTRRQLSVARGDANTVQALAFSPDGRTLAVSGEDSSVGLWEVPAAGEDGPLTLRTRLTGDVTVLSLAFAPDGRTLACGCANGEVRLWNVTGAKVTRCGGRSVGAGAVWSLAFAADGRTLAVGGWGIVLCEVGADLAERLRRRGNGDACSARLVAFMPGAGELLSVQNNGALFLSDPRTGQPALILQAPGLLIVTGAALTADGRQLLLVDGNGLVSIHRWPDVRSRFRTVLRAE
jgi:hypothetical protein